MAGRKTIPFVLPLRVEAAAVDGRITVSDALTDEAFVVRFDESSSAAEAQARRTAEWLAYRVNGPKYPGRS